MSKGNALQPTGDSTEKGMINATTAVSKDHGNLKDIYEFVKSPDEKLKSPGKRFLHILKLESCALLIFPYVYRVHAKDSIKESSTNTGNVLICSRK